jgi:hypothetical protein
MKWYNIVLFICAVLGLGLAVYRELRKIIDKKSEDGVFSKKFQHIRNKIKTNRDGLQHSAILYLQQVLNDDFIINPKYPLIVKKGWIPERPVNIDKIKLGTEYDRSPELIVTKPELGNYKTYSQAIEKLDKPDNFRNDPQYRLLKVEKDKLTFSSAEYHYFDKIDNGEYLVYEFAESIEFNQGKPNYHKIASGISDLNELKILAGISTLFLLVSDDQVRFLMGQRKKKVGSAEGTFHVIPAGEFQPSSQAVNAFESDLVLWRNIMRESAEEILGKKECDGSSGIPYNYNEEPFISLDKGKDSGAIQVFYLGFGLDPLSFQGEILTCALFKEELFNQIYKLPPRNKNKESLIDNDDDRWGREFNKDAISLYNKRNTLTTAKTLLKIAFENIEYMKAQLK